MTVVAMSAAIGFEAMTRIKRPGILAVSLLVFLAACTEEGSGEFDGTPKPAMSIWDSHRSSQ
jgi:hypothetical protein